MRLIIAGPFALLVAAASAWTQVRIPNRPPEPLFKGSQGKQRTELHYDPATGTVTIKFVVQDPNGNFIPNIRRENFAVYENGVRQTNISATVEHAPISLGLLLEHGGRHPALNHDLTDEVSNAAHQLVDTLGQEDAAAVWAYGDSVDQLTDFTSDRQTLSRIILGIKPPEVSETNLYDAVIFAINRARQVPRRKGIVLISSGVDTFSKSTYEDAVKAARQSDAPVYAISLAQVLQQTAWLRGMTAHKIDLSAAEKKLGEIARASGGRLYSPEHTINLAPIYDDIIENLKVRYVITYHSSNQGHPGVPRKVRIELVEAESGKPLRIVDASGRPSRARVIAEESYTPAQPSGVSSQ